MTNQNLNDAIFIYCIDTETKKLIGYRFVTGADKSIYNLIRWAEYLKPMAPNDGAVYAVDNKPGLRAIVQEVLKKQNQFFNEAVDFELYLQKEGIRIA